MDYKNLLVSAVLPLALVACGSGSDEGDQGKVYSIEAYSAVESSDTLAGTWVMVANGTEKEVYGDYWEEGSFSSRNIVVIRSTNNGFEMSSCGSSFSSLSMPDSSTVYVSEGNGSPSTVVDNLRISGSTEATFNSGSSRTFDFEYRKISESTQAFGSISWDWSGLASSTDTTESLFALCSKAVNLVDSDGDRSINTEHEFGVENYMLGATVTIGTWYGEPVEMLTASGNSDTISASTYWDGSSAASVEFTESDTSFSGTFSATDSGESVVVTVSGQL